MHRLQQAATQEAQIQHVDHRQNCRKHHLQLQNHPVVTLDLQIPDAPNQHHFQQLNNPDVIKGLQILGARRLHLNHPQFPSVIPDQQTQDVPKQ